MKVGDYVRTDTGKIGKITLFEGDLVRVDTDKFITYKSYHNEITKISPNIIDLIEVGDFVNGRKIDFISGDELYSDYNNAEYYYFAKEDIKTIVTKEQFEAMEYKCE